jgi:hypothetical protein
MIHDIMRLYSFNKASSSFQQTRIKNWGIEGDPVVIAVQNLGGVNNAVCGSPDYGQMGGMTLFFFYRTSPNLDSAF